MKRITAWITLVGLLAVGTASVALAYEFPSTNDANRTAGHPHVNLVESGPGYVELEFVNDTNSLAYFEVRLDGDEQTSGTPHPVVIGDYIYPGVGVDGRGIAEPVIVTRTFEASATVEVRLALGGERDWDFDWVTFEVGQPEAKAECRSDFASYGFRNQGQCIRYVETGKDSR